MKVVMKLITLLHNDEVNKKHATDIVLEILSKEGDQENE